MIHQKVASPSKKSFLFYSRRTSVEFVTSDEEFFIHFPNKFQKINIFVANIKKVIA